MIKEIQGPKTHQVHILPLQRELPKSFNPHVYEGSLGGTSIPHKIA